MVASPSGAEPAPGIPDVDEDSPLREHDITLGSTNAGRMADRHAAGRCRKEAASKQNKP